MAIRPLQQTQIDRSEGVHKRDLSFRRTLVALLVLNAVFAILVVGVNIFSNRIVQEQRDQERIFIQGLQTALQFRDSGQAILTQLLRSHFVMKKATQADLIAEVQRFDLLAQSFYQALNSIPSQALTPLEESQFVESVYKMQAAVSRGSKPETSGHSVDRLEADANFDLLLRQEFQPALSVVSEHWSRDLEVARAASLRWQNNSEIVLMSIFALIFCFNLALLIMLWRTFQFRIQAMDVALKEIGSGNFSHRILIEGTDELSELSRGLNNMTIRLLGAQNEIDSQKLNLITSSKFSALGQMAAGVAHEINNPLAIVLGKVDLLLNSLRKGQSIESERLLKDLEKIQLTGKRIAKIVAGMKSFSRDGQKDPLIELSLQSLIEETLSLCSERFKNHNFEVLVSTIPDLGVMGRPSQLSQVLLNLLNNAFDAVAELPERWVRIEFEIQNTTSLRICVTDSGPGISDEIAQKLMQPFFTTKDVGKGTGLGLSISRGIMEDHRGALILNRNHARTQFVMELPIAKGNRQSPAA